MTDATDVTDKDTPSVADTQTVVLNLGRIPVRTHKFAKVRAAQEGVTLKAYIENLILDDVRRVNEAHARRSE